MDFLEIPLDPAQSGTNSGTDRAADRSDRAFETVGQPHVIVLRPDRPTGASVVILPGGGYRKVVVDKEGLDFARVLAGWGITALVVTYRLPGAVFVDPPLPVVDARRALSLTLEHQAAWGLDPDKRILMGFSAGGHLALTTAREPGSAPPPSYLVLGYPVVDFHPPLAHEGSKEMLLGPGASPALVDRFSGHVGLPKTLKGVFVTHADNDASVPVGNSEALVRSLAEASIPCEFLRHPTGGHGYGWGPRHGYAEAPDWEPALHRWLVERHLAW